MLHTANIYACHKDLIANRRSERCEAIADYTIYLNKSFRELDGENITLYRLKELIPEIYRDIDEIEDGKWREVYDAPYGIHLGKPVYVIRFSEPYRLMGRVNNDAIVLAWRKLYKSVDSDNG